ncbi:MAG: leucyl aminopeptidase family protein, partial [Chryseobacterium sp.]
MKLLNKRNKNYAQIFELFTEESWSENSKKYNKNISLLFSGKKNEIFIDAKENTITYFIGLGKSNLQNFEFQQVAMKFSQSQKKNFQAVSTL